MSPLETFFNYPTSMQSALTCVCPLCQLVREGIEDCTVARPLALRTSSLSFPPPRAPTLSPLLSRVRGWIEDCTVARPLALRISSLSFPPTRAPTLPPLLTLRCFSPELLFLCPRVRGWIEDCTVARPLALWISSLSFPPARAPPLPPLPEVLFSGIALLVPPSTRRDRDCTVALALGLANIVALRFHQSYPLCSP